jgi:hypothetical protein
MRGYFPAQGALTLGKEPTVPEEYKIWWASDIVWNCEMRIGLQLSTWAILALSKFVSEGMFVPSHLSTYVNTSSSSSLFLCRLTPVLPEIRARELR